MIAVSMTLLAAGVVSMIANLVMASRLRAAKKREEAKENERKW